jgi:phosphoadenosine phosphosulfate reductase
MRPEIAFTTLEDHVAGLNARFRDATPAEVLDYALHHLNLGPVAMVSSFGAEAVALLHLLSEADPSVPVLFLETEMHFAETRAYQREVADRLNLGDVRLLHPDRAEVFAEDPEGDLHRRDPDACCALRKTRPLEKALAGFGVWISGRKRFQRGQRAALEHFEVDAGGRVKVNPLAHWSASDIAAYMDRHDLPRHPLVAQGYLSIGCAPCTSRVRPGEDARSGRWRGTTKVECGIHLVDGRYVRAGQA